VSHTEQRLLDAGQRFPLWAPASGDGTAACNHGVLVDLVLDASADDLAREVRARLASAERLGDAKARVEGAIGAVRVDLGSGRVAPCDDGAARFVESAPWLEGAFGAVLDVVRHRAERAVAQRDRSICRPLLEAHVGDELVPYEDLFPADWDVLVASGGSMFLVIDHHCLNPACPCTTLVLDLRRLDDGEAVHVGDLRVDRRAARPRPEASTAAARALFPDLWREYGAELRRRHDEVRAAVQALARERASRAPATPASAQRPGRNAPCPCGSGKKRKRCCGGAAG
jgi:hypothetical protein